MARPKGSKNKATKEDFANSETIKELKVVDNAVLEHDIKFHSMKDGTPKVDASFIKPLVTVEGQKNIYQELIEDGETPVITAVGCYNLKMGRHTWISYTLKIKGDRVISMEVSEPDMKAIAIESVKTDFVLHFESDEI